MKQRLFLLSLAFLAFSCSKDDSIGPSPMIYTALGDTAVGFGRNLPLDLDSNGQIDIVFGTRLVADPLAQQDTKQWLASSSFYANLPVSIYEQIPVMNRTDLIPQTDFDGYNWYNAASIVLVQKVMTMATPPFWEGSWRQASHQFIPIQLAKENSIFNGWVEVSFSMDEEKLILHRAAVSTKASVSVRAGD